MPQSGETPLARFAHAIAHEDGASIGTPRLSDEGSTVVLPIVRSDIRRRLYVLAAEVSGSISAIDTGRLDRLRVRNDSGARVFLPPGTLFVGRETPSRATAMGVFLEAGSESGLEVKCVHADRAIAAGAALGLVAELAPDRIAQALLSRDQGLVWATVGEYVGSSSGLRASDRAKRADGPRDLVEILAASESRGGTTDAMPRATPGHDQECGVILLDAEGVLALEIFDSPESWNAASRSILQRYARHTPRESNPSSRLALDPASAVPVAKQFLSDLARRSFRRVALHSWVAADISSAYTELDGEVVHLLAFGRDVSRLYPAVPRGAPREELASGDMAFPAMGPSTGPASGDDSEVAVAEAAPVDLAEVSEPHVSAAHPRRRKVLTSGWDATTFESLERFSRKEFRGDRSAAIRSLVRHGLGRGGYLGPQPVLATPASVSSPEPDDLVHLAEPGRSAMEARIHDFERIAQTDAYADWLRKRARLELERMVLGAQAEPLRSAARSALDRLPPDLPIEEPPEPVEIEAAPPSPSPLPPTDVRPLLRRAFAASAGGRYAEALVLFDEVLDAEPENRTALLGRAVALRRSGKAQEALEALDIVLRVEPTNAAALLNRGRILQEHGDLKGALDTFDVLASVAANDWDVWMARGDVLARMGKDQDALRAYAEALRRNPEDEGLHAKIRGLEKARSAPPHAASLRMPLPRDVQQGQSYVVREKRPDLSLRVLRALVGQKVPPLIITRQPADRYRAEPGLAGVHVLVLSHSPGEGHHDPTALVALTRAVERFVEENGGRGVILLDGIATLVLENGFRDAILFVERVHETILQSQAVFLVSLAHGDLEFRESALLERSLKVLS